MPDHEELLKKTYNLALHNNKMLRSMKRAAFWGTVFKIVFWALMLGVPVYLYFTIFQPILADLLETYTQLQQTGSQIREATNVLPLDQLQGLLDGASGVDLQGLLNGGGQ